jgi:hypothetical protein
MDQTVMTEQVTRQAQQVGEQAQQAAQQAVSGAKSVLDSQKERGAQTLTQTADALRKTSQDLQQNNIPVAGQIVDMAAGKLEDTAGYLRSHNVAELLDTAEQFARNNGAIVTGGAFVLGLLAARFLKSSPSAQQGGRGYAGYRPGGYRGNYGSGTASGYGQGYEPYPYGETFAGYSTGAAQPGFEAGNHGLEPEIPAAPPAGEGTV